MGLNFNKLGFLAVALTVSSAAWAGGFTPATCTPGNVTVPCAETAWDVGFTGMYVQATNNDLYDYRSGSVGFNTHNLHIDYDFAFTLQGSYHWGTGKDVNLNWTHYDDSHSHGVATGDDILGSNNLFLARFYPEFLLNIVNSEVKFKHDAVNLEFGQTINVGDHVDMRFHAGGQWARVDGDFYQSGRRIPPNGNINFTSHNRSEFDGIGPRAGMDASYHFGKSHLSAVGRAAAAVLVGDLKTYALLASDPTGNGIVTTVITNQKTRTIIPSLDGELGVAYSHAMAQGDLSLEVGYRVAALFHAVRWVDSANATRYGLTGNGISNFGYHGPYATLKWMGNLA